MNIRLNLIRPTDLSSGIDKDRPDYIVCSGQWDIGRIYQARGGPENMRWFWSMTINGPMTRSDLQGVRQSLTATHNVGCRMPPPKREVRKGTMSGI